MTTITIARQYGAGASVIGRMVAERLGYQLIDREMLDQVAKKANVSARCVEDMEKISGDRVISFLSEVISASPIVRNVPGISTDFDENKYIIFLKKTITEVASRGRAVIVGRGSQMVLKDHPDVVRIYVVAEEEARIRKLMEHYKLDRAKAQSIASREEKKRLAFLEKFEDGDSDDVLLYHLIINTGYIDFDLAVDFICGIVAAKEGAKRP